MNIAMYLFIIFIFLMLFGMPIGVALGIISVSWVFIAGSNIDVIASRIFGGINSFVLMAMPFFILAGEIMNYSGITARLVNFVNYIIGRVRGGLAQANIYASTLFAGITGAAVSDVAALGSIFIPAMEAQGYSKDFSCMITAASAIVGPIIPPSITIVVYCSVTGVSVGAMFAATIVPGVILSVAMSIYTFAIAKKRNFPRVIDSRFTFKGLVLASKDAIVALMMPIIIIGGILGGIFTPTEAAAVAVLYAFVIGVFVFKSIDFKKMYKALRTTVVTSSMLFFLIGVGTLLGWIVARVNLSSYLANMLLSVSNNANVIFILVAALLLFVGTWLDTSAAIIIFAPILTPLMEMIGFHRIHFGAVMVIAMCVGLITPPLGVCIFTVCGVGNVKFENVVKEIWPYIIIDIIVILLLVYFPGITLTLPRLLGLI